MDRRPISRFIDGLSAEEIVVIEQRMRDPLFSQSHFLGVGESLVARIEADAATLYELCITHGQLADRLEAIVREARRIREIKILAPEYRSRQQDRCLRLIKGKDTSTILQEEHEDSAVVVDSRFSVTIAEYKGYQYCPFDYNWDGNSIRSCYSASVDFEIRNTRRGSSMLLSELLIHMIRDHQFFEGEGLRYRVDPRLAADTLELGAGAK